MDKQKGHLMNPAIFKPHMEILGLDWGASADAVKRAFRAAARKAHPDIAGDGAHDAMSRINAAYDILKHGVPDLSQVKDSPRIKLKMLNLKVGEALQDKWRMQGEQTLAMEGIVPAKPGIFARLLRRQPQLPLHVPTGLEIFNGFLEITLDTLHLHKGINYLVIPELKPNDGRLVGTGNISIHKVTTTQPGQRLRMQDAPDLERAVLPDHRGLKIVVSNRP